MNVGMKKFPVVVGVLGLALALSGELAKAAVITQWTFSGNTSTAASNANTPAPTTGSGYATQLGMTNPYNGGSIAACDFLSTNGTANPSYGEYLWRVRDDQLRRRYGQQSSQRDSQREWLGDLQYQLRYRPRRALPSTRRAASWIRVRLDTRISVSASIGTRTTQGVRDLQFQYNLNTSNSAGWTNIGASHWKSEPAAVANRSRFAKLRLRRHRRTISTEGRIHKPSRSI